MLPRTTRPRPKFGPAGLLLVVAALSGLGVASALEGTAAANGRFPESQRLLEHPTDPNRLYLTTTYGLLLTADRGRNWYYVCEHAFALKFLQGDPLLEVFPDGSLLGGIYETMNLSADCGCSWRTVLGESPTQNVVDMTTDREGRLLALLREDAGATSQVAVMESVDQGRTWTKLSDLPAAATDAYTIDVAPSDPSRLYVSAFAAARAAGVFLTSKNRGQTWAETDVPRADGAVRPFIAAVHPSNPDRIFMRMDEWSADAEFAAQDGLLYSADAGKTWREVLHHQAKLYGFALSPDGSTVLAGYGDPFEAGGRTTNSEEFGVYKASTADLTFEKILSTTVACLRWTPTGVYVCTVPTDPASQAMALGFAPNADFTLATGAPLTSLLDLRDVHGPLACLAASCKETWATGVEGTPPICEVLQARCDADLSANKPTCGGSGGAGGAAGGAAGSGGAGGPDGGMSPGGSSAGCGCRAADRAPRALWIVAALGLLARRFRKRPDARPSHRR